MPSDKAPRPPQAPRWRSRLHEAIQAGVEHPPVRASVLLVGSAYEQTSLEARILLGRRQQVALTWVEQLSLSTGSRVLEIGWGAGATAVELVRRGHLVAAWTAARPCSDGPSLCRLGHRWACRGTLLGSIADDWA